MKPLHLLWLLLMNVAWGVSLACVNRLGAWLDTGGIVTLRFALAALLVLPLWPWLGGPGPRGRDLARAAGMGVLVFMAGQRLQVLGNHLGSAGNSAVLMGLEPVLTAMAAALFLREKIPARRGLGCLLGLCGVVLLNGVWRPGFQWISLGASLIFIASFFCETAYSILGKPMAARTSPAKVLAWALVFGSGLNLASDGPRLAGVAAGLPLEAWLLLGYLALVCTVVGYTLWLWVLREADLNLVALTIFVQPVAGVPIAVLWLGEQPHWGQLWGCLAIGAGLLLGFVGRAQRGT